MPKKKKREGDEEEARERRAEWLCANVAQFIVFIVSLFKK